MQSEQGEETQMENEPCQQQKREIQIHNKTKNKVKLGKIWTGKTKKHLVRVKAAIE